MACEKEAKPALILKVAFQARVTDFGSYGSGIDTEVKAVPPLRTLLFRRGRSQ